MNHMRPGLCKMVRIRHRRQFLILVVLFIALFFILSWMFSGNLTHFEHSYYQQPRLLLFNQPGASVRFGHVNFFQSSNKSFNLLVELDGDEADTQKDPDFDTNTLSHLHELTTMSNDDLSELIAFLNRNQVFLIDIKLLNEFKVNIDTSNKIRSIYQHLNDDKKTVDYLTYGIFLSSFDRFYMVK